MTVPEALQDRNLRQYRLRRHRLPSAGGGLSVVAPARGDDLLLGAAGEALLASDQLPYWAEIWPASLGLARQLMRAPSLLGQKVMDLGCGIGLAGLAAAKKGAKVLFVDRAAEALHFARFNARQFWPDSVATLCLDWSRATAPAGFDLLLLADVAYEERNFEPLLRHLRHCLAPDGTALLADPLRQAAGEFLGWIAPWFSVNVQVTDTFFADQRVPLRLASIRRRLA